MAEQGLNLTKMRMLAERAGLNLTDEELSELAVGIERNDAYSEGMRRSVDMTTEPAFLVTNSPATEKRDVSHG